MADDHREDTRACFDGIDPAFTPAHEALARRFLDDTEFMTGVYYMLGRGVQPPDMCIVVFDRNSTGAGQTMAERVPRLRDKWLGVDCADDGAPRAFAVLVQYADYLKLVPPVELAELATPGAYGPTGPTHPLCRTHIRTVVSVDNVTGRRCYDAAELMRYASEVPPPKRTEPEADAEAN